MRTITIHDRNSDDVVDATIQFDGQQIRIDTPYPMLEEELFGLLRRTQDPNAFMDEVMRVYSGTYVYAVEDQPSPQPTPTAPPAPSQDSD